jgi:putative endonuclease
LYVGQTNNLEKRLKEHRSKSKRGAKYTRYFSSLELVYSEKLKTRGDAMRREAELKKWPKKKKEELIGAQ